MQDHNPKLQKLVPALLRWFAQNARDLPWRRTRDPYAIWVSEIMLQQTQVKTVIPYWNRWMRVLQTIEAVANASPEQIHKLWEGLGYYTRVRNLQKTARQIMEKHPVKSKPRRRRGNETQIKQKSKTPSAFARLRRDKHVVSYKFPDNFDDVLALPGIGRYTAGAICSIAFNQPTPILDGNVIRVLTRLFGIRKNPRAKKTNALLWRLAEELVVHADKVAQASCLRGQAGSLPYYKNSCSALNQSLMELGALVCTPRLPQCHICPIKKLCVAFREDRIGVLPNLGKREAATARHFIAFVVERNGRFLVRQRPAGVVNAHLWEFPNTEFSDAKPDAKEIYKSIFEFEPPEVQPLCTIKHSITRYRITMEAFHVHLGGASSASPHLKPAMSGTRITRPSEKNEAWLPPAKLDSLAFTAAHRRILRHLQTHSQ